MLRFANSAILIFIVLVSFLTACSDNESSKANSQIKPSVNFIDVGFSECTFIKFNDGKTMMIDCGDEQSFDKIKKYLSDRSIESIDWLILTHPDDEHVGGAVSIMQEFSVKKLFAPKLDGYLKDLFVSCGRAIDYAIAQGIEVDTSDEYDYLSGEDYFAAILSPKARGGSYAQLLETQSPTEQQADDVSAVVYLEYCGVRFLFTGDARYEIEEHIVDNYVNGLYSYLYDDGQVDLSNVDFLKVSRGGLDGASGEEFLNLLSPKNSVIFTGYGRSPSALVLNRLHYANEEGTVYRTDVYGNVSVIINGLNSYTIELGGE